MLSLFGKPKNKSLTTNSSQYHRENNILIFDDLKAVLNKKTNIITKNQILYQGLTLDKINMKELEKYFDKETFLLDHTDKIRGHKVYFYRKNVENYKLTIQLHFIEDIFFYASTKVSSESQVTDKDKKKICATLLSHYPDIPISTDSFEYEFMDTQGNIISTRDHIYLYINYYANNTAVDRLRKMVENPDFTVTSVQANEEKLENFL
ncbi:MAG: hypothetical protein CVT99_01805 [Bacteroidetes bacterium HGW-Bacteroidetes-16]|jgi:hypothetical protein|nr:MAG: hypothetical protein CVT99_01805 [Bacteroidetes bacterium HGW-Bacteroidetes-16]